MQSCEPSGDKGGDANERDGNTNIIACNIYGIVIHRQ